MKHLPSRRILLVDDDAIFSDRLALSLIKRGHIVDTAASLNDVESLATNVRAWEAAVVDLRLPSGSGLEIAKWLRTRIPAIRVLILTGYGSISSAVEAMRIGTVNYLSKPADTRQIESALFGEPSESDLTEISVPSLEKVEWEHLQRVLQDCEGNVSKASRVLGIERRTLQRKLQKFPPLS